MLERYGRWGGLVLGGLLVALGVAETVRAVTSGDGGVAFWFGTLVGGGACVLAGTLLVARRRSLSTALLVLGCAAGAVATSWTLVVPVLLALLVVARLAAPRQDAVPEAPRAAS